VWNTASFLIQIPGDAMKRLVIVAALALLTTFPAKAQLFVGTGAFGGAVANDIFEVDVVNDMNMSVLSGIPFWGATYDALGGRVLFTTSGVGAVDGADLFQWVPGDPVPSAVGEITLGGVGLRIDGLAISGGVLYGVHQFDDATGTAGIYSIDMTTLAATMVQTLPSGAVSGIDSDPNTGILYGVDDTALSLISIDLMGGTSVVAAYPASKTDIDGLAVSDTGLAYLIPDDGTPGEIFVYDLNAGMYLTSLTSPLVNTDTFSAGAFMFVGGGPVTPVVEVPTLSTVGLALLVLTLLAAGSFLIRRRRNT
jgi:hypothetical protein